MLNFARDAATRQAAIRGLDAKSWDADALRYEGTDIVGQLFSAIQFDASDRLQKPSEWNAIAHWEHRAPELLEHDWRSMRFDRQGFRDAADRYLECKWLQHKALDWFVLDALTYAEYIAYLEFTRAQSTSILAYATVKGGSTKQAIMMALGKALFAIAKWSMWLLLVAYALSLSWLACALFVGVTVLAQASKYRRRRSTDRLLAAMARTYSSMATVTLSWQVIWDELSRSRTAGVVWDGVVYKLVEDRMRQFAGEPAP